MLPMLGGLSVSSAACFWFDASHTIFWAKSLFQCGARKWVEMDCVFVSFTFAEWLLAKVATAECDDDMAGEDGEVLADCVFDDAFSSVEILAGTAKVAAFLSAGSVTAVPISSSKETGDSACDELARNNFV